MNNGYQETELDDDQLIFVSEIMLLAHLKMTVITPSTVATAFCSNGIDEMLREALRGLLRVALQDPRFRKKFQEHFAAHPISEAREAGWEWLSEVLTWES